MTDQPLTADQVRAAALLARGRLIKEVAAEVGVSPRTVSRWSALPAFKDQVRRQREALFPADGVPTAEGALLDALGATKPSGEADHQIRIAAAKAILSTPVASADAQEEARRTDRIYLPPPNDDGAPRPTPIDPAEIRRRGEESEQARIEAEVEAAWAGREEQPA